MNAPCPPGSPSEAGTDGQVASSVFPEVSKCLLDRAQPQIQVHPRAGVDGLCILGTKTATLTAICRGGRLPFLCLV